MDGKYNEIKDVRHDLLMDKMKMDKFFSKYLSKLGAKMDFNAPNTPIWKLYHSKMIEYAELEQTLRSANYYLKKSHV